MYYLCSKNKGADQLRGYLICAFVFAYADCWFSHATAHLLSKIAEHTEHKTFFLQNLRSHKSGIGEKKQL